MYLEEARGTYGMIATMQKKVLHMPVLLQVFYTCEVSPTLVTNVELDAWKSLTWLGQEETRQLYV